MFSIHIHIYITQIESVTFNIRSKIMNRFMVVILSVSLMVIGYHGIHLYLNGNNTSIGVIEPIPSPIINDAIITGTLKKPTISEEEIAEIGIYGSTIAAYKVKHGVHPNDDKKFYRKYTSDVDVSLLRKADYGVGNSKSIPLYRHEGGERISKKVAYQLLEAVAQRMPNLKTNQALLDFGYHTLLIETGCGRDSYENAVTRYNNFGIAQFRVDTAHSTMDWLRTIRPDVYNAVHSLYDKKESMEDNLLYNVPFSVALMYQYYWRRVPNFQEEIDCIVSQGALYKAHYNSPKGLATIGVWLSRLNSYNTALK